MTSTTTTATTSPASMSFLQRLRFHIVIETGSTRAVALFRIFFTMLVINSLGDEFLFWKVLPGGDGPQFPLTQHLAFGVVGALFLTSSPMVLFGYKTRPASIVMAISLLLAFFMLGDSDFQMLRFRHHHTQLMMTCATALACAPAGRSFSVDRYLAIKKAQANGTPVPAEWGRLTGQRMICFVITSLYFGGAVDKMRVAYLSGHELERTLLSYFSDADRWPMFPGFWWAMGIGSVVWELVLAFGLWVPRLQKPLIIGSVAFHILLAFTMNVGSFGAMTCLASMMFLHTSIIHRACDLMMTPSSPSSSSPSSSSSLSSPATAEAVVV